MIDAIFTSRWFIQRARQGLFGRHIDRLAALFLEQGYRKETVERKISVLVAFGRWLAERRIGLTALNEQKAESFFHATRRRRTVQCGDRKMLRLLLDQLRQSGDVPPPPETVPSALERALQEYTDYLVGERGLAQPTVRQYTYYVRAFLGNCFGTRHIQLSALHQADTHKFLRCMSVAVCAKTMHGVVASLRSYLTFLHLRGDIQIDLASGIPAVACWRLSTVPKYLKPAEVQRVLDVCDRSTIKGQRDYTILLLLARLGLLAGEVVAMRLDDIHWDTGEMLVRGKGRRHDRLPIPKDVGEALATYLRDGRPRCQTRHVFVRLTAPRREFACSSDISTIVRQTIARAGLHPPYTGAHVLRHSLATHMLQSGASLAEIGEALRHRNPITTELYSKVDFNALRPLAQPWPGEGL
jgi:site-specific recombinase XerD